MSARRTSPTNYDDCFHSIILSRNANFGQHIKSGSDWFVSHILKFIIHYWSCNWTLYSLRHYELCYTKINKRASLYEQHSLINTHTHTHTHTRLQKREKCTIRNTLFIWFETDYIKVKLMWVTGTWGTQNSLPLSRFLFFLFYSYNPSLKPVSKKIRSQ